MIIFPMIEKPSFSNDNSFYRTVYMKIDICKLHGLFVHIPTARNLIKRYSKDSWKHSVEARQYASLEFQLCTILNSLNTTRHFPKLYIKDMARVLGINPIELLNDSSIFLTS